jgi:3-oxoacyl-[acyl-carrier-protein] synthase I
MASGDIVVVGIGMMTAVGLSAPETAASARSGLMRFSETPIMDRRFEPFTLAEVPDEGLPELADGLEAVGLTSREARMLRLAALPLLECVAVLPKGESPPPLLLALPETRTTRELNGVRFLGWLGEQAMGGFDPRRSDAAGRGRAGGVAAIGAASALLASGQATYAVAGGVDTYRDVYVLGTLDMERRVKSAANLDGFIPGEGAGFVLLTTRATAERAGLQPIAALSPVAVGVEPGHLYSDEPYRGDGLANTLQQLFASDGTSPVGAVYSSMNGESHWAKEWGVAFLRNKASFDPEHGIYHPADCYGDLGAAAGPMMVGLAALGVREGYRASQSLVYGSSDCGGRAAVLVRSAQD